jgi:hypothetical protein
MASLVANVRRLTARAQPWPDRLARIGFIAKGLVYLAVGWLAFVAASGEGGKTTSATGALADGTNTEVGRLLIGLVALGLFIHAVFRALLALVAEPYGDTKPTQRLIRRVANTVAALFYFGLGTTAAVMAQGSKASAHANDDASMQHGSAWVLHAPLGRPLLIAVACGVFIAALVQLFHAGWPGDFGRRLRVEAMNDRQRAVVAAVGRLAYLSRATILATIAFYLWRAGIDRAPREARGSGGALHAAWEFPHGNILLAMMAAGMIAVGAFAFLEARWRRFFKR